MNGEDKLKKKERTKKEKKKEKSDGNCEQSCKTLQARVPSVTTCPNDSNASFNSSTSIDPPLSVSNNLNASLNSNICSSDNFGSLRCALRTLALPSVLFL